MTYQEVFEAITCTFQPNKKQIKTILIRGVTGIGKTSMVFQLKDYYEQLTNKPWMIIKRRLSDLFAEDFSGLPKVDDKIKLTRWFSPDFLPLKGSKKFENTQGILLLDEVNRAKPDVLQAVMKVLDRDGFLDSWLVVATANLGVEDGTNVEQLDRAQERRFLILDLEYSYPEWEKWAKKVGIHPSVLQFLSQNPNYGFYEYLDKRGKRSYVTPAHWEEMSQYLYLNEQKMTLTEIVEFVGPPLLGEVAFPFLQFLHRHSFFSLGELYQLDNVSIRQRFSKLERSDLYQVLTSFVGSLARKNNYSQEDFEVLGKVATVVKENGQFVLDDDGYVALLTEIQKKAPDFYSQIENRGVNLGNRVALVG